tara:strand:+ start:21718 stop:22566 length:849 start_codon:yes stop_codon:yes gene_type:complete
MAQLKTVEKAQLEELLEMGGGYVLDFASREKFAEFFRDNAGVDIYNDKYLLIGDSMAKRLRAFWEIEPDELVGNVLSELIAYWHFRNPTPSEAQTVAATRCEQIVGRLLGQLVEPKTDPQTDFLDRNLEGVSIHNVPLDAPVIEILESRYDEAQRCLHNGSPLASIFMAGSVLEGLLLGMARANPKEFNQSNCSPKDEAGKVKEYQSWTLAQFIEVACDQGYLQLDVKKFSHELRDFRNYIHPYQQLASGFKPDEHTARICLQVLRAAIASLSNQRSEIGVV